MKPGGFIIISTHGNFYKGVLGDEERYDFEQGKIIVRQSNEEGKNECMSYHPQQSLSTILPENMKVVAFIPEGAKGSPYQDIFLIMKLP